MENIKKKCKILGFGKFTDKETGELMIRILISVPSNREKYVGRMVPPALFFNYEDELKENLIYAIKNDLECEYTTTDDIVTGKTKVNQIIFN